MNYEKEYFVAYVLQVVGELEERNIKINKKLWKEILLMTNGMLSLNDYPEHNNRYLLQCYYNLQEKADRGIISKEEFEKIENLYKREINNEKII